ncbi:ABC transporter permease [Rhizobium rhizogenes]|uniref:ABC transporter permease n=1 Tax=Rhizobium rhizogenes TaxID=359 RepID=UPI001571AE1E|nr:ABC transporter permease [Rhizobium rhizogenes]NTI78474.1 ABC transporter permease [Rhizobium rhizogenes]
MTAGISRIRSPHGGGVSQGIFVMAVLALWYAIGQSGLVHSVLLPALPDVVRAVPKLLLAGDFWSDVALTLYEVFAAFAIASVSGVAIGYFVGTSRVLYREFEPLIAASYAVPLVLFFPIFVLVFGLGPASKIAMAAATAFFPVALNTISGFSTVNRTLISAANLMGASKAQMMLHVMIPAALPVVATGLRMGLVVSLLATVGTETIVSTGGLGHRMAASAELMDIPAMYACIILIIVVAFLLIGLSSLAEARLGQYMGVGE